MRVALCALALLAAGCDADLPEPDSAGARLYAERCSLCHALYGPGTMTYPMWKVQVERMQGEMVRRGVPPLRAAEKKRLLGYLERHAGG